MNLTNCMNCGWVRTMKSSLVSLLVLSFNLAVAAVAHEKFTVKVAAPMAGKTKLDIDGSQLFRDDGKGEPGKEVKSFTTDDTGMHARWNLKQKALIKGVQVVWRLVEAEGEKARRSRFWSRQMLKQE